MCVTPFPNSEKLGFISLRLCTDLTNSPICNQSLITAATHSLTWDTILLQLGLWTHMLSHAPWYVFSSFFLGSKTLHKASLTYAHLV